MKKKSITAYIKKIFFALMALLLVIGCMTEAIFRYIQYKVSPFVYTVKTVPSSHVGIVFGARVYSNKRLAPVTLERVTTAALLYEQKKIQKILISGDNRTAHYNEPVIMRNAAVEMGVHQTDITLDYAGFRTYDTCYRAKEIFAMKRATLITQELHLWRAIYTCRAMGLDVKGVAADSHQFSYMWSFYVRERLAMILALFQVHISKPRSHHLGKVEPIP